ncbi:hypothetical protein R1flu_013494 [Riccia fluitans]|uniref:Uncharacterized protein n=1 Tax=Riccia fluitans TaxID=41844 RepID=A0ABD1YDQ5_9MARC
MGRKMKVDGECEFEFLTYEMKLNLGVIRLLLFLLQYAAPTGKERFCTLKRIYCSAVAFRIAEALDPSGRWIQLTETLCDPRKQFQPSIVSPDRRSEMAPSRPGLK